MKVRLNEDKEVVARVKEGLKRTGGYCPCRLARLMVVLAAEVRSIAVVNLCQRTDFLVPNQQFIAKGNLFSGSIQKNLFRLQ